MVPSSSVAGLLNLNCVHDIHAKSNAVHPHDPTYDFLSAKSYATKMTTGMYYLLRFVFNTSHLWLRGLWLHKQCMATLNVLQMLPATSLCIQQDSGLPGAGGQLLSFTDIYQIDV